MLRRLLPLLVVGCGNSQPPSDPNEGVSGSRLRVVREEFADGTRVLASHTALFDTELGQDCTVTAWPDGVSRRTPLAYAVGYMDKNCTQAIGWSLSAEPHAAMYFVAPSLSEPPKELHVPQAELAKPSMLFRQADGGACIADTPAP